MTGLGATVFGVFLFRVFLLELRGDYGFRIGGVAKLLTGPIISEIRGKCGDVVFSRNRGGMFSRRHGVRVKPWSQRQLDVRSTMQAVGLRWNATLTDEQRAAWNAYAETIAHCDQLKQACALTGQNAYARVNMVFMPFLEDWTDLPPAVAAPDDPPLVSAIVAQASPALLTVDFSVLPSVDQWFLIWTTPCLNVGVTSFGHRWCGIAGCNASDTFPFDITTWFATWRGALAAGKFIGFQLATMNVVNLTISGRVVVRAPVV